MKTFYPLLFLSSFMTLSLVHAQDQKKEDSQIATNEKKEAVSSINTEQEMPEPIYIHKIPSVGLGVGILSFYGDVNNKKEVYALANLRQGFNLNVEQRFLKHFGVAANIMVGKLAQNEDDPEKHVNFESKLMQGDVNLMFHIDNNRKSYKKTKFAPFVYGGIGFISFKPYGDMMLEDGTVYNYWSDGSIRNTEFDPDNPHIGDIIQRDHIYETELTNSDYNYATNTLVFPVGVGIKFKFSYLFDANIQAAYYFTQSDFIDNEKGDSKNDAYFYSGVSLRYNIAAKTPKIVKVTPFDKVDFNKEIDGIDSDRDGVKDMIDLCGGTPRGVRTDEKGCPLDTDADGIPDYLDKEKNTAKGALVDASGMTIKEQKLLDSFSDSLATPREGLYDWFPSYRFDLDKNEQNTQGGSLSNENNPNGKIFVTEKVPKEFQKADMNNDGIITPQEINNTIDAFFEDDSKSFSAEDINKMIEYFKNN